jgi:hypothetical protein
MRSGQGRAPDAAKGSWRAAERLRQSNGTRTACMSRPSRATRRAVSPQANARAEAPTPPKRSRTASASTLPTSDGPGHSRPSSAALSRNVASISSSQTAR